MSLRYGQDIICGEIDNREQGKVKGTLLFAGWEKFMTFELEGDLLSFGGQCVVFHNPRPKVIDNSHYLEQLAGESTELKLNKRGCLDFLFESPQEGFINLNLTDLQFVCSNKKWEWDSTEAKEKRKIIKKKKKIFESQVLLESQREKARVESSRGERKVIVSRIRQMQAQLWMGDYEDEGDSLENLKAWEQHLQMLMDFEGKTLGLKQMKSSEKTLAQYPFTLKPEVMITDEEIEFECWRLIYSLSACSIYISRTDHLSWRELYTVLMNEILDSGREPLRLGHFSSMRHIDVVDLDENAQDLNLRYYAYLDERQCMEEEYGVELPPIEERPFDRDKDLPRRAGF